MYIILLVIIVSLFSGGAEDTNSQPLSATITLPGEEGTAAVIEVPQNLVPLLMSGKSEEPIKIG